MDQHLMLLLILSPFALGDIDFYVGYGDRNDQTLRQHPMYNQSIGVYHRRNSDSMKFCSDKSVGEYSMGLCKNFYAECDKNHELSIAMCPENELYRAKEHRCVDERMEPRCYHVQYADNDQQCKRNQHQELIALGKCENQFGVCFGGSVFFVDCHRENEAFSDFYGTCLPKHEHPKCDRHRHHSRSRSSSSSVSEEDIENEKSKPKPTSMEFWPLSTMCHSNAASDYEIYLGACNEKYMFCDRNAYDFLARCETGMVADGSFGHCVPKSHSAACPANWDNGKEDADFVEHMNTILKSIDFCKGKSNGLYFDQLSECHRETIFCYKGDASFHLCPRSFGIDENGWCAYKEVCDQQNHEPDQWRAYFLASFASDAKLCQKSEIEGLHIFGLCLNFYGRCRRGRFEIEKCEDSREIFDSHSGGCRLPTADDHCDKLENTTPINRCVSRDKHEISKMTTTGKCEQTFLVCVNGWEITFKCEKIDYVFHEKSESCIPKAAHPDCPDFRPRSSEKSSSSSEIIESRRPMTCHGDGGFYEHEEDCAKFYRCAHGRLVEMSCPEATAFDSAINVCNHKHLVARCSTNKK